jgi:hypothetical protein
MKRVLVISYDLANPGQNYEQLLQLIKQGNDWARLGGSAYLVSTDLTPVQVRDALREVLDPNDKLFVGASPAPSAWSGMPEVVSKWIQAHQK